LLRHSLLSPLVKPIWIGYQAASDWQYVSVRRLALYIEASLIEGTKWATFEPNDRRLWSQLDRSIGTFMQALFAQ
jgi:uncharacterized protein